MECVAAADGISPATRRSPRRRTPAVPLLALLLLLASAAPSGGARPNSCPQWIAEYEAFHAANRNAPGARYLVHAAAHGLGNRLRGAMTMLRMAAASKRVLLLTWQGPLNLTSFFQPPGRIDWRPAGTGFLEAHPKDVKRIVSIWLDEKWAGFEKLRQRYVVGSHFIEHYDKPCPGCPPLAKWSTDAACAWHALFAPVDAVGARVAAALRGVYGAGYRPGAPGRGFVAMHMRLGGMIGEHEAALDTRTRGQYNSSIVPGIMGLVTGMACAEALGTARGIDADRTPVLLITDHHALRAFAARGGLRRAATPPIRSVHIAKAAGAAPVDEHLWSLVDMGLLSEAACMVHAMSSFNHQAWLWGGARGCRVTALECAKACPLGAALGGGFNGGKGGKGASGGVSSSSGSSSSSSSSVSSSSGGSSRRRRRRRDSSDGSAAGDGGTGSGGTSGGGTGATALCDFGLLSRPELLLSPP